MPSDALIGFEEKPSVDYLVSMGVYVVSRAVLVDWCRPARPYGFDDLMLDLLARRRAGRRPGRTTATGSIIGRPDDYVQAIDEFERRKDTLLAA